MWASASDDNTVRVWQVAGATTTAQVAARRVAEQGSGAGLGVKRALV